MKKLLVLIGFCCCLAGATAQNTVVSATVVDHDGTVWANGAWKVQFYPSSSNPNLSAYRINGAPLVSTVTTQTGVLNGSGVLGVTVYDNTQIAPSGSYWELTVCPNSSAKCGVYDFSTAGATTNISAALTATIPSPRFNAVSGAYGYLDTEVISQNIPGSTYYNVTNKCVRVYDPQNGGWGCSVPGSGIPAALALQSQTAPNTAYFTALQAQQFLGAYDISACANTVKPSWCAGSDIGAWINAATTALNKNGVIVIPDNATYNFSTNIVINQTAQFQQLTIHCASRSAVLNFTGSGDAIYITGNTLSAAQVIIENCTLLGGSAAANSNGIHLFAAQTFQLRNSLVNAFKGTNLIGEGSIDGLFVGNDFVAAGSCNVYLAPDTVDSFASNTNRFIGGSMQFGGGCNLWDAGNLSAYGGNTSNSWYGVTFEMSTNTSQIVIEGTKSDAIEDCYIEYINYPTAIGDLYGVYVGNFAGSGVGSNLDWMAKNFKFSGNYMIMPANGGFNVAALRVANSDSLTIDQLFEDGNPAYGISFYPGGTNHNVSIGRLIMGFATALYQNFPAGFNMAWAGAGATPTLGQFGVDSAGNFLVGGLVATLGLQVKTNLNVASVLTTGINYLAGLYEAGMASGASSTCAATGHAQTSFNQAEFCFDNSGGTGSTANLASMRVLGTTGISTNGFGDWLNGHGIIIPTGLLGYHGSGTATYAQTSDNTGTSTGAAFDANGTLTGVTRKLFGYSQGTATSSSSDRALGGLGGTPANFTTGLTASAMPMMTDAGILKGIYVACGTTGFNASSGVFTVQKQAAGSATISATTITVTYGTTTANTMVSDTAHTVAFAAGDRIGLKVSTQATETLANCAATITY